MKRILIIDDHCCEEDQEQAIREGFAGTEIDYFLCSTAEDGRKHIRSGALFDCIVLDWYLEDDDSSLSRLILKELENTYYAPVLIYSSQVVNFREDMAAGAVTYPENLIREVEKDNFQQLRDAVLTWLDGDTTAKLASIYLHKINDAIHRAFWTLNEIPHGNIAAVYKHLVFENGGIDWSNDFIINLLSQTLVADEAFRGEVTGLVEGVQHVDLETTNEEKQKILNRILYFQSNSPFVCNADLVKISQDTETYFGIIVTPNCDLVQSKTRYLDYVELRAPDDSLGNAQFVSQIKKNASESHFTLTSVEVEPGTFVDLTAIFKSRSRLISLDNNGEKYPSSAARIRYDGAFTLEGNACELSYICSLLNPYKAEFTHKKASHDNRVGTPSLSDYISKS